MRPKIGSPEFQPEHWNEDAQRWCRAGFTLTAAQAISMVRNNISGYAGPNPTRRMLKISTEVLKINVDISFRGD